MRSNAEFIQELNDFAKAMVNGQGWIVVADDYSPSGISNQNPLIVERLNDLVGRGAVPVGLVGFMPVGHGPNVDMFCSRIFAEHKGKGWAKEIIEAVSQAWRRDLLMFIEFPCVKGGCNGFRF